MYEHKSTKEKLNNLDIIQIAEFYKTHSARLTCDTFSITQYLLAKILEINNIPKHSRGENYNMSIKEYDSTNCNKRYMHNLQSNEFKMIPEEDVNQYLLNGWVLEGPPQKTTNKGRIVITDGDKRKYINLEDLDKWEIKGWYRGEPRFKWSDESKQKYRTTIYNNYGVVNVYQIDYVKDKSKQTCLEKYGVEYTGQSKVKIEKTKATLKNKTPKNWEEISEKISKTKLNRYGDSTYNNREKATSTCLEKYGVINAGLLNSKSFYYKDGTYFDSSWELALWIYAKDHNEYIEHEPIRFEYLQNDKKHYYIPDFLYNGKYIDLKGSHLVDDNLNIINPWDNNSICEGKTKCIRDNNVELWLEDRVKPYLDYVNNKYGIDYLKQFKIK